MRDVSGHQQPQPRKICWFVSLLHRPITCPCVRSPETGNPAKSLLCPPQKCPQVQWLTGGRTGDSAGHPHSLKATENPAPISTGFRRKPSILCLFVDSNDTHVVGNRVTILIRKKTFLFPVIYTHCSHIKSVTRMTDP